jgi:hypothetical protein
MIDGTQIESAFHVRCLYPVRPGCKSFRLASNAFLASNALRIVPSKITEEILLD